MKIINIPHSNRFYFDKIEDVQERQDPKRKGIQRNSGLKGNFYNMIGLAFKDNERGCFVNKRSAIQYLKRNCEKIGGSKTLQAEIKNLKLTSTAKDVKKVFDQVKQLENKVQQSSSPESKKSTDTLPAESKPSKLKTIFQPTKERISFDKKIMSDPNLFQAFLKAALEADLEIVSHKIAQNKTPVAKGPGPKQFTKAINDHRQSSKLRLPENKKFMIEGGICNGNSLWFATLFQHALKEHPKVSPAIVAKAIAKLFKEGGSEAPAILQHLNGDRISAFGIDQSVQSAIKISGDKNHTYHFLFGSTKQFQKTLKMMPNGCYTFNFPLHTMLLIKDEQDIFFFDPNKGLFIYSVADSDQLKQEALFLQDLPHGRNPIMEIEKSMIGMNQNNLKSSPKVLEIFNRIVNDKISINFGPEITKGLSKEEIKQLQNAVTVLKDSGGVLVKVNLQQSS